MQFTVVCLVPDVEPDTYTPFIAYVDTPTPLDAEEFVREQRGDDVEVIAIFEGHHEDVSE
jgi:hypothetical protein